MITDLTDAADARPPKQTEAVVELVIPVYNEEAELAGSVIRLDEYLRSELPYSYCITIADNASNDRTWTIAQQLRQELSSVRTLHLDEKGRGRALKAAWSASGATVVGYMDVDLSTDLRAVLPLLAPLLSNHSDLAIGTRLSHRSRVIRGPKREFISRSYNLLLRSSLSATFSDAQCGFKAIRHDVAEQLLPLIEDDGWFFDTELLVIAERAGLRIHEVPVDWTDDPDSRVEIVATATADVAGIARLSRGLLSGRIPINRLRREFSQRADRDRGEQTESLVGPLIKFGFVGVLSTLTYLVLYLLLRLIADAQIANLAALLITAIGNTATNRRLTFGVRGGDNLIKHHVGGLVAFALGLGLTSGSLWLLSHSDPGAGRAVELVVLVLANGVSTLIRFLVLRRVMRT